MVRAWLVPAVVAVGGIVAGCATISGLDSLERVDCIDCDGGATADARPLDDRSTPVDGVGPQKDVIAPIDAGPTHSIGGTVSGLTGRGLVLENNGDDDIIVTADGPFTFRDRLNEKATYSVEVLLQPSDQTCIVVNGAGTIGSIDVTNVNVNCGTKTYSIGGTVSGLTGTGLVLQNGGQNDLPISGNGPFTFSTGLANGANYAVSVLTQPSNPSQACAVSSASGVVTGANVTGVVVNCSSGSFTVGGSVTGLVGSGLVLQNNAGNDLAISANGSFSFSTPIQTGNPYAVTVRTQPSTYEQACTVTNGTGSIGGGNVSNVQIACGPVKSITLTGVGGAIPDGRPSSSCASSPGPPRTSDISIPSDYFMINGVTVTLSSLSHTFAGDLLAQLSHVERQTTIDLFRRVESTSNQSCGSQASFQGTYRFDDSFTDSLWSFPATAPLLRAGDYFCSTSGGTKAQLLGPGGFRGQGVSGTWRLTIIDNVAGDTGTIGGWTLRLTP
jgi:trimeric autotransporter adhesin